MIATPWGVGPPPAGTRPTGLAAAACPPPVAATLAPMRLEPVDLPPFLHGCLDAVVDEAGLRCWRHSARQREHFADEDGWRIRMTCPSGVRLVLRTDSPWIELELVVEAHARRWGAVDLAVDGRPVVRRSHPDLPLGTWSVRLPVPRPDPDRICSIWLPHTLACRVAGMRLATGSSVEPVPVPRRRWLAMGDSITQGLCAQGPATCATALVASHLGLEHLNQGVGGHIWARQGCDPELAWNPDLVTCAYGTNDWATDRPTTTITDEAVACLRLLRRRWPRARLVLQTPIWRQAESDGARHTAGSLADVRQALRDAAAAVDQVQVIDGTDLVPHDSERLPDGVHPGDAGFGCYALHLLAALRKLGWEGA